MCYGKLSAAICKIIQINNLITSAYDSQIILAGRVRAVSRQRFREPKPSDLEQSLDLTLFIHVNALCGRLSRQPRHGHDVTAYCDSEFCTRG